MIKIRTVKHPKITTRGHEGEVNGFLVPIYNMNDGFFAPAARPQQVYLTAIAPHSQKGPHLHFVRTGYFTCIKGNIKVVLRVAGKYVEFRSGEAHEYLSVEIPTGVPALLVNETEEEALVLNMPCPAWTPEMKDEHSADFSDYRETPL